MSMGAALKAERALALATRVVAVEILCACQAIDLLAPLTTSSPRLQRVHARVAIDRAAARRRSSAGARHRSDRATDRRRRARSRVRREKSSKKFFSFKLTTRAYVFRLLPSRTRTRDPSIAMNTPQPTCQRAARRDALLQGMAAGSRAADADEQSRSRGCRAARRSRRLRRLGTRRAQLGGVRRHRRHAAPPRARRDAGRAVGQTGRRLPHASVGAARPHRQRAARAGVGDLGHVPRSRRPRPDDVRPDDGRQLDLHRHAGHPAGHLRDARRSSRRRHFGGSLRRPPRRSPPASAAWAARSRSPSR